MSLSEGDSQLPEDPFEMGGGGGEGGPEAEAGPDKWWGLRNTEPPVTPEQVGEELDIGAEWHDHALCGFIKQTGGGGAEAWMHYVMAVILLFMSMTEDEESLDEPDNQEAAVYTGGDEGPETFTADEVLGG